LEENRFLVGRGEKQILAVTVVLLLGEKASIRCYCGATASNRQKNQVLVGACGEKLDFSCCIRYLMGEKTDLSCYCGATVGRKGKA
jgi:hypothetical protein